VRHFTEAKACIDGLELSKLTPSGRMLVNVVLSKYETRFQMKECDCL